MLEELLDVTCHGRNLNMVCTGDEELGVSLRQCSNAFTPGLAVFFPDGHLRSSNIPREVPATAKCLVSNFPLSYPS